jgi:hypothetical protein
VVVYICYYPKTEEITLQINRMTAVTGRERVIKILLHSPRRRRRRFVIHERGLTSEHMVNYDSLSGMYCSNKLSQSTKEKRSEMKRRKEDRDTYERSQHKKTNFDKSFLSFFIFDWHFMFTDFSCCCKST